jgi:hypothetical protein
VCCRPLTYCRSCSLHNDARLESKIDGLNLGLISGLDVLMLEVQQLRALLRRRKRMSASDSVTSVANSRIMDNLEGCVRSAAKAFSAAPSIAGSRSSII